MPIYEYYCPDNHTIYQFYARSLAQGQTLPVCPDNPSFRMEKMVSAFAISKGGKENDSAGLSEGAGNSDQAGGEDPRMEAALSSLESEFSSIDENDPKAMGRMMRRMAELTGENIDGEMEELVRKLEEGTDPEVLEEQMGAASAEEESLGMGEPGAEASMGADPKEPRHRYRQRRQAPFRDPKLYDY